MMPMLTVRVMRHNGSNALDKKALTVRVGSMLAECLRV